MSSGSGQKLSLEELKGRNLPQTSGPQEQSLQAEMENLLEDPGRNCLWKN